MNQVSNHKRGKNMFKLIKVSALLIIVLLISSTLVFGGGEKKAPEETKKVEALEGQGLAPVSNETVYFRGWAYKTDIVEENVKEYNDELNGNVDYATITGDYPSLMEMRLIAKDKLDVLYANAAEACRYYAGGYLIPAEDLPNINEIKADLLESVRQKYTYKGKLIGLPYYNSPYCVHVNLEKYYEAGFTEADYPKNWDELYDMCYVLKEKGYETPFLPLWFTEWSGISWGFYGEVLSRGGKIADWESHEPLVTVDGPAGDTLRAWKKIWNDRIIPHELISTAEADYLEIWGSGRFVFGLREMYDLKRYNNPRYSKFAGKCSVIPQGDGYGWSLLTGAAYVMSSRPRSEDHTRDVMAFISWLGYKNQYGKTRVYDKWIRESMFMAVYKSQLENPELKKLYVDSLAKPEDYEVCVEISENTRSPIGVDNVVWSSEFNAWVRELLQKFLVEDRPVDETIKAIRDKINEFNKKYGVR